MGREDRAPTAAELEAMKQLVETGMLDGAYGLSSGLKYIPGAYSETEEVIELAKVAGRLRWNLYQPYARGRPGSDQECGGDHPYR